MGEQEHDFTERLRSRSYQMKYLMIYLAASAIGTAIYYAFAGTLDSSTFLRAYLPFALGGFIGFISLRLMMR